MVELQIGWFMNERHALENWLAQILPESEGPQRSKRQAQKLGNMVRTRPSPQVLRGSFSSGAPGRSFHGLPAPRCYGQHLQPKTP